MKKLFVPAGEMISLDYLYAEAIHVKGVLQVKGKLVAKKIMGSGSVEAEEIICDDLRLSSVTTYYLTGRRVVADKLFVQCECRVSESIAAKDYVTAGYISTGKISMTLSDVGSIDADEIITLKPRRSLIGLLWASWWRGIYLNLVYGGDDDTGVEEQKSEGTAPVSEAQVQESERQSYGNNADILLSIMSELRKQGYHISKTPPKAGEQEGSSRAEVA